jgi:hypothetical protein
MSVKAVSVDKKGMVYANCPFCWDSRIKPANSLPNGNQPTGISVTCSNSDCGKTYEIKIDFRQCFRKKTFFDGFYSRLVSPGGFGKMTVVDLSLGGCSFLASSKHSLNPDDRIKVVFNLDNTKHTKIEKDVVCLQMVLDKLGQKLREGFRAHINLSCHFSKSQSVILLPS